VETLPLRFPGSMATGTAPERDGKTMLPAYHEYEQRSLQVLSSFGWKDPGMISSTGAIIALVIVCSRA
jgi:hypothetical protein